MMDTRAHPTDRDKGNGVELSTEEARAGHTPHMTRHVLGWGLGLVVVGFLIVLAYFTLST